MKVTAEKFLEMKKDLKVVLDHFYYVHGVNFNINFKEGNIPESTYYRLWSIVFNNRKYNDENLNVIKLNGKRLLDQNNNFEYYVCDTNDNTIFTAIKKAVDELVILY